MSKSLPLFPLNLVAYPGELLNLHIFEPRYIALITDCLKSDGTFGIPSYVLTKIALGTEMEIVGVEKKYDDGRMDIKTKGLAVIKVKDFQNPWKDKSYAGGTVQYVGNDISVSDKVQAKMVRVAKVFFDSINAVNNLRLGEHTRSYDIAHKIGLTKEEEYQLLEIESEEKRANFVIKHLMQMTESMNRAEEARRIIIMNGHFKNLDPLNF